MVGASGSTTRLWKRAPDRTQADSDLDGEDFGRSVETARVVVAEGPEEAAHAVGARVEALRRARTGRVLGVDRVLRQRTLDAPRRPKRSPAPLCHAAHRHVWLAFRDAWRAFVADYRAASKAFRAGALATPFPDWTFRPSTPLLGGQEP